MGCCARQGSCFVLLLAGHLALAARSHSPFARCAGRSIKPLPPPPLDKKDGLEMNKRGENICVQRARRARYSSGCKDERGSAQQPATDRTAASTLSLAPAPTRESAIAVSPLLKLFLLPTGHRNSPTSRYCVAGKVVLPIWIKTRWRKYSCRKIMFFHCPSLLSTNVTQFLLLFQLLGSNVGKLFPISYTVL